MPKSRKRKRKKPITPTPTPTGPDALPAEMRAAIEAFYLKGKGIVDAFAVALEKQPIPPMIYHYTNDDGLQGIIESGKLWFTDIFYLNDPSELRHGLGPAIDMLTAAYNPALPEIEKFTTNFEAIVRGSIRQTAHYFVCSFSTDEDELGQWRAYGDNGRGYAIGFDGVMLEKAFAKAIPGPGHMAFPLSYRESDLHRMHRQIIDEVLPLISLPRGRSFGRAINHYMSELAVTLSVLILNSAVFFKHKAYRNEQEYRYFQLFPMGSAIPDLKYRRRPYSMVRYRDFDWRTAAPDALKNVTIGPAADLDRAFQFAEDCLRAFHKPIPPVHIGRSTIPYRA